MKYGGEFLLKKLEFANNLRMKILFICSSLEKGKDGVGDYNRRLSGELIRQGHQASIIALNDKHSMGIEESIQKDEDNEILVLRLGKSNSWNNRIDAAKQFITNQNPDWLSLQYVSFGFQDKGLPFGLTRILKQMGGSDRKWHVMFHELWVGMNDEASFKLKIWGKIQKYLVLNLLRNLKPIKISTQTDIYAWQLKRNGFTPHLLPLCSNIKNIKPKANRNETEYINIAIFGSICQNTPFKDFITEFLPYQNTSNGKYKFLFMGRNGVELPVWTKICSENNIKFEILGELPGAEISNILNSCHIGISTTPVLLAQKSGVVAAYLAHHLKVVFISRPWHVHNFPIQSSFISPEYPDGNFKITLFKAINSQGLTNVANLANNFVENLNFWSIIQE